MKFGVVVPIADDTRGPGAPAWAEMRAFGQRAEALGFDSLWAREPVAGLRRA